MRLHRFFVPQTVPLSGEFTVTDANLLNQWRNVLRMEEDSELVVFDGGGDEARCIVHTLDKKSATLVIKERRKGFVSSRNVTLYMALIKRDHFELVLEKATELGVSRIVPVIGARTEKKGINWERSEKILREAAEQSGHATVPVLGEPISVREIPIEGTVVFDPHGELSARAYFNNHTADSVGLAIGSEGGFTDEEIALFKERGIPIVTTGQMILRAETAAIAALTLAVIQ